MTAPIASATSLEQFNDLVEATRLDLDAVAVEQLTVASALMKVLLTLRVRIHLAERDEYLHRPRQHAIVIRLLKR